MASVDDSTRELAEWLHPIADRLGVPDYLVTLVILLVIGVVGRLLVQKVDASCRHHHG